MIDYTNWIAKDKDGSVHMFTFKKPVREDTHWKGNIIKVMENNLDFKNTFSEKLSWEDEPIKVFVKRNVTN